VVCACDSLERVCGSECGAGCFVMCVCVCVRQFGLGLQLVCSRWLCGLCVFGTVWNGFGGVSVELVALWCVSVCVGHFGTGLGE